MCNPPRSNMEYMYMYIIIMNISIALTTLYKTNMVEFQSLAFGLHGIEQQNKDIHQTKKLKHHITHIANQF